MSSQDQVQQIKEAILRDDSSAVGRLLDEDPGLLTPALWPTTVFQAGSLAITRLLLIRGLDPDESNTPRKPLHFAVDRGRPDLLKELLAAGADPNVTDGEGFTPLDLYGGLVENRDPATRQKMIAMLRESGARVNVWTALRIGDIELARLAMESDPALIHAASPDLGFLPLHVAARMGDVETVVWLLAHGAEVDVGENTALWFTCQSGLPGAGRLEVARTLLAAGATVNRRCEQGSTPLHYAAWRGPVEMVNLLLAHGAQNWIADVDGKLPLDYAKESVVSPDKEAILGRFNEPRIDDPKFSAAVDAIRSGDLDAEKSQGNLDRAVERAVLKNDLPALRCLLDSHPERLTLTGGPWDKPLLHIAAWEGHLEVVLELLKRGTNVNVRCESDHACAIHFAAERGHLAIVRALVDAGADMEGEGSDHGMNVLGWATSLGQCQEEIAGFLISRGANITIWSAIALNKGEIVRALVQADPASLQARMSRNEYHRTPLHHAVEKNRPEMVGILLELGADASARDSMDIGPLGAGGPETDPAIRDYLAAEIRNPTLHEALLLGRFEQAEELLALDPGCIRPGGSDARLFVYAVTRKNWAVAGWLLARGADINAIVEVYQCPATALHFAIESAPVERVRWLLEQGADTTIKDGRHGADALGWAEFFDKPEVASMIQRCRKGDLIREGEGATGGHLP